MNTRKMTILACAAAMTIGLIAAVPAGATTIITLPDPITSAVLYGNAYSYSLPTLAYFYNQQFGVGTGPGTPFYVDSSPGQIKDDIVIGTGAGGANSPVVTNAAGMNDAYATPGGTGGLEYFSTGQTGIHPAAESGLILDTNTKWNANISALMNYLTNDGTTTAAAPVFFFNNNQTNSGTAVDQELAIWGQAILVDAAGVAPNLYFTLANYLPPGDIGIHGGAIVYAPSPGGILSGSDKGNYTSYSRGAPTSTYPLGTMTNSTTPAPYDFVLSGGQVCYDAANNIVPCDGSGGTVVNRINHNLGANQAAYAVTIPGLNTFLETWTAGTSPYDVLQLDIRMGCNPTYYPNPLGLDNPCPPGTVLNNGYEQIFIGQGIFGTPPQNPVPEPASIILIGSGLVGLALLGWRRRVR